MTDELRIRLRARAKTWARNITKEANQTPDKPKHIKVSSKVFDKGNIEIISTGLSKNGDARAYEFGSGIHSRISKKSRHQISPKGKILIRPRNKKLLAFYWDVANANPEEFTFSEDGRVLFRSVKHPGVKAAGGGKGYLAPAINKVRKQIRREVPKDVREAYLGGIRRAFKK